MARKRGDSVSTAAFKILQKINEYELISGEAVSDLELSKEFNMSRTPVREAIQQLLDSGLIERTSTKAIVKPVTMTDIKEIFEVREAIELMSVNLIFMRGGLKKTELDDLNSAYKRLYQDVVVGSFQNSFFNDSFFHEAIVAFSCNSRLADICRRINLQEQRLRWISQLTPSRYYDTVKEHQTILAALTNQNQLCTEQAIRSHLKNTYDNYANILNNKHLDKLLLVMKNMNV